MPSRKQPEGLARAREQRRRAELDARAVAALERLAAAIDSLPERLAIFVQRTAPVQRAGRDG